MPKATPDQKAAMDYFSRLRGSKDGQLALSVSDFLRSWANEKQPLSVYAKALGTLERQAEYTPEKIVHRIVLEAIQAWTERHDAMPPVSPSDLTGERTP